jgi:hypothetical protein
MVGVFALKNAQLAGGISPASFFAIRRRSAAAAFAPKSRKREVLFRYLTDHVGSPGELDLGVYEEVSFG